MRSSFSASAARAPPGSAIQTADIKVSAHPNSSLAIVTPSSAGPQKTGFYFNALCLEVNEKIRALAAGGREQSYRPRCELSMGFLSTILQCQVTAQSPSDTDETMDVAVTQPKHEADSTFDTARIAAAVDA